MIKRKNILINPNFQIRFTGWMVGIALTEVLVFYSSYLYFFKFYIDLGKKSGLNPNHIFFKFLSDQYRNMNYFFISTAIFSVVLLVVVGLVLSHRIAGPIYRMCKHLNQPIKKEDIGNFKFRPGDYFLELASSYNNHLKNLLNILNENDKSFKKEK